MQPHDPPSSIDEGHKTDPAFAKVVPDAALAETSHITATTADENQEIDEALIGSQLDFLTIQSLLGQGAMGRVYRAWNERLHRVCAVKVIAPSLVRAEPERLEMFLREARAAAQLNHPNVVTIHLLGQAGGFHYIEMEFVPGQSLAQRLKSSTRLSPLEATTIIHQIASGLFAAHANGLLHCDVKPDNVMLANDKWAKLGDFGLARAFGVVSNRQTQGTPYFMAPELFSRGGPSVASDVYALGVTAYLLLTGGLPFTATSLGELQGRVLFDETPDARRVVPEVSIGFAELITAMMDKDPLSRPRLSREFLNRLESLATELIPTRDLVADAFKGTNVVWQEIDAESFTFLVPLNAGRKQIVFGEVKPSVSKDQFVMSFWTPCGPARSEDYAYVLEINGKLPYGAISIRERDGVNLFVITSNHPRATLDPGEIHAAVLAMAHWADVLETKLTGKDEF